MATPVQKNFKREMTLLNKEGHSWYDSKYNSFNGKKKKRSFGKVIFILAALMASGLITKVYNEFQIAHDQKIRNYLQERDQYFIAADMGLKQMIHQFNRNQDSSLAPLLPKIIETHTNIQNNYDLLRDIDPPREFRAFHESTMDTITLHKVSVEYLLTAAQTNTYRQDIITAYINESNLELSKLRSNLIAGLQKADIKYQVNEDGSLTYWVQEHGYESVFN
ncbi:hypothetical protein D3H55_09070 [Bacillus salacetis]|uniref:Uncharacterized protein n=1 Tax=Bacillus salacetis TaxID=2315464 RepID=A0A3A1QZD9_9BACI|nr:hypothetical protein [Bacillus salacetis]RIW34656.1 hypothetical protein D3H55_09070 [Bacillus salacetis]